MRDFRTWKESGFDRTALWEKPKITPSQTSRPHSSPTWKDDPADTSQFKTFRRWYDYHRGHWQEVEQAAASDPQVQQILASVKQFQKFSGQGKLGDELEAAVKRIIPNHGHKEEVDDSPPGNFSLSGNSTSATRAKASDRTSLELRVAELEKRIRELEARLK